MSKKKLINKQKSKRKPRSKFRPSFRERCVFSFGKAFALLHEATDKGFDLDEHLKGMHYMSCLKHLSHAIEMLSKAVLASKSPFLVMKELGEFNKMFADKSALDGETCGGHVALARASKLFKKEIRADDLAKLTQIIDRRNLGEHREFYIASFDQERHLVISAAELFVSIYDSQFKNADLLEESSDCLQIDLKSIYSTLLETSSAEFAKVQKEIKKLLKQERIITVCEKCYYETALVSGDKNSYECLWCKDRKKRVKCSVTTCNEFIWADEVSSGQECGRLHFFNKSLSRNILGLDEIEANDQRWSMLKSLLKSQKIINEKMEPAAKLAETLNKQIPKIPTLSSFARLSDLTNLGSVNPKGDDAEDDDGSS